MAGFGKEYQMMFALNGQVQSGFTNSFSKAQATVAKMQSQLIELNNQQSQISAYEKQQQAIEKTQSKLQLLTKQYDNIQRELEETGGKSSDLQNKLLAKQSQIDKTSHSLQQQTDKLNAMGDAMTEAGIDVKNLTGESNRLESEMAELKKQEEAAAEQANELGNSTIDALNGIGSALVAAGIIQGFKELANAYKECLNISGEFEASMSQVAATMGTTSGSIQNLGDYAKQMGATTSFSAIQSAEGLNILAMSGLNAEEQIKVLPVVLDLAAAGNMDLAQSAGYVTTSVKGFQDSMDNAQYYADLMAKGATMANTNVQQLGEALATSGATANTYSQAADSVTLSLLRLAEQGEVGSAAGTMLNRAMTDLYAPTENASKALDELNFSAYDAYGNARDFNDVIDDLNASLEGYSEQQRNAYINQIFTTNGMQAFNKMTSSTSEKVEAFYQGLKNSAGSASRQAKTQLDNMNGSYIIMQSALEGVQISMGELWQGEMTNFYKMAGEILGQLNEFIKQNPGLMKAITGGTAALATLTAGVVTFNTATKLSTTLLPLFSASLGGLPLLAVAAGIAGVVAVGGAMYDSFTKNDRAAAELTQSAQALSGVIEDANTTFDDTIGTVEATANVADNYINKLQEMEEAGLTTDEAQKQYHNTLELLVQTIPELADQIDLENDSIKGGTAALRERTKAWEEEAKAQAYQQKMSDIYAAQADVMIEAEKNSIRLTKAQQDLDDAQKKRQKAQEDYAAKQQEFNERLRECSETGEGYAEVMAEINMYEVSQRQAIIDAESALIDATDAYEVAKMAVENDAESVAAATTEIEIAQQAYENLTGATEESTQATQDHTNTVDAFNRVIGNTEEVMETLTGAYNEAYEAAYKSINGQYNLWDEAAKVTTTSIDTINSNLASQQAYWESYNANLDTLAANVSKFDGLGDVLASFVDGSEESVSAVAGIADAINKGNDADVQQLITNYKSLQEEQTKVSESVADMQTEYTERMSELAESAGESVQELNLSDEARAAATETINSYINTISGSSGRVSAAYRSIYNAALSSLKSAGGSGAKDTDGYASGTENAQQGYKLVGEEGPELMYFHGGEKVYDADETKNILSNSQLDAKEHSNVTTQSFNPNVNIAFNITGTKDTAADLQRYADDFAEKVLDVLENNSADLARRAFA